MTDVLMKLPGSQRGKMATKLLEAAKELELGPAVIRSQSEGFLVPEEVHRYLFPSEYEEKDDDLEVPSVALDNDPAKDFGDLTEEEQEALTNPAK